MFHLLPPLLAVSCLFTGSSAFRSATVCYGETFNLTTEHLGRHISTYDLYFTPSRPEGSAKLLVKNNKLFDPRYKLSDDVLSLPDVTGRDEGVFSIMLFASSLFKVFTLTVSDCAVNVDKNYGDSYSFSFPRKAERLDFIPLSSFYQWNVLWNRSDPQTNSRGMVQARRYSLDMRKLTQADNGLYSVRDKNNKFLSRTKLTVTERSDYVNKVTDEEFALYFDLNSDLCTVTFVPALQSEGITVMEAGVLVKYWRPGGYLFSGRIRELPSVAPLLGIEIKSLKTTDSGRFLVQDQDGNPALTVSLTVNPAPVPTSVYIGVAVGIIFSVILCCCCVKKCCCGKSSSKSDAPVTETAADPPVYYHDESSKPSVPSSSTSPYVPTYTYQPTVPLNRTEPKTSSVEPQEPSHPSVPSSSTSPHAPTYTYQPSSSLTLTEPLLSSGEPQVPVTGGQTAGPSASNFESLLSGPEPQFELKGLTIASVPPLSSDTNYCDVYTSDKLNFL